jgi:hypothetical protein
MISDTMTTGPTSEIWCGSRKEVNISIHKLRGYVFPSPDCLPQVYHMNIQDINKNPASYLELMSIATPFSDGTYFVCA